MRGLAVGRPLTSGRERLFRSAVRRMPWRRNFGKRGFAGSACHTDRLRSHSVFRIDEARLAHSVRNAQFDDVGADDVRDIYEYIRGHARGAAGEPQLEKQY